MYVRIIFYFVLFLLCFADVEVCCGGVHNVRLRRVSLAEHATRTRGVQRCFQLLHRQTEGIGWQKLLVIDSALREALVSRVANVQDVISLQQQQQQQHTVIHGPNEKNGNHSCLSFLCNLISVHQSW